MPAPQRTNGFGQDSHSRGRSDLYTIPSASAISADIYNCASPYLQIPVSVPLNLNGRTPVCLDGTLCPETISNWRDCQKTLSTIRHLLDLMLEDSNTLSGMLHTMGCIPTLAQSDDLSNDTALRGIMNLIVISQVVLLYHACGTSHALRARNDLVTPNTAHSIDLAFIEVKPSDLSEDYDPHADGAPVQTNVAFLEYANIDISVLESIDIFGPDGTVNVWDWFRGPVSTNVSSVIIDAKNRLFFAIARLYDKLVRENMEYGIVMTQTSIVLVDRDTFPSLPLMNDGTGYPHPHPHSASIRMRVFHFPRDTDLLDVEWSPIILLLSYLWLAKAFPRTPPGWRFPDVGFPFFPTESDVVQDTVWTPGYHHNSGDISDNENEHGHHGSRDGEYSSSSDSTISN